MVALDQNIDKRDCALESGVPRCSTQQGGAAAPERYATPSSSSAHRRAPVWAAAAAVRLHATISAGSSSEAIRRNNASESSCEPPRLLRRPFALSHAGTADWVAARQYAASFSAGGMFPIGEYSEMDEDLREFKPSWWLLWFAC